MREEKSKGLREGLRGQRGTSVCGGVGVGTAAMAATMRRCIARCSS
jgi:hypothetical protein